MQTLFHVTDMKVLSKIIKSNKLKAGAFGGVSFTENSKLFGNTFEHGNDFGHKTVRFVIDGDKLSNDYELQPWQDGVGHRFEIEEEWRVQGTDIQDLKKYTIRIEILNRRAHDNDDLYWVKKDVGINWDPRRRTKLAVSRVKKIIELGDENGFDVTVVDKPI
tara:strand:- start:627 stop:1112 length:486 start_codon:yes stop_codon:yes gene_type:complete